MHQFNIIVIEKLINVVQNLHMVITLLSKNFGIDKCVIFYDENVKQTLLIIIY